jgi:hypothetical protein
MCMSRPPMRCTSGWPPHHSPVGIPVSHIFRAQTNLKFLIQAHLHFKLRDDFKSLSTTAVPHVRPTSDATGLNRIPITVIFLLPGPWSTLQDYQILFLIHSPLTISRLFASVKQTLVVWQYKQLIAVIPGYSFPARSRTCAGQYCQHRRLRSNYWVTSRTANRVNLC